MKKIINVLVSVSLVVSSNAFALDLRILPQNTDKTHFQIINDPFNKDSNVGLSYMSSLNPLVFKRADGTTSTLVNSLQVFELSIFHKLSDKVQLGLLIPGENPSGILGPYEESKTYLGNILIEPKIYFAENIAFIPVYYVPQSNSITTQISNQKTNIETSKKSGYGAKIVAGFGDEKKNETLTAIQVGAIMAPEDQFRDIDQSEKIGISGGISYPLNDSIRLLIEAYAEKTKSASQLEALAGIQYKNGSIHLSLNAGSGDLASQEANKGTISASMTYTFNEKKEEPTISPADKLDESFKERYYRFVPKKETKEISEENGKDLNENESIEEQSSPSTERGPLNEERLSHNPLMLIEPKRVKISKISIPIVPKEKPIPNPKNEAIVFIDRKRQLEVFKAVEVDHSPERTIASISNDQVVDTKEQRARLNIKNALNLLENNLFLYEKFMKESKEDKAERSKVEIKWAIRVFQRNIEEIQEKDEFIEKASERFKLARSVVKNKEKRDSDLFGNIKIINTSKVILKTADVDEKEIHFLTILPKNSEVYVLNEQTLNEYVQIKPANGKWSSYQFPIFILKRYLSNKSENLEKVQNEDFKEINTIQEIKALESILEEKINLKISLLEKEMEIPEIKPFNSKWIGKKEDSVNVISEIKPLNSILEDKEKNDLIILEEKIEFPKMKPIDFKWEKEETRQNMSEKIEIVSFEDINKNAPKVEQKIEILTVEEPVKSTSIESSPKIEEKKIEIVEQVKNENQTIQLSKEVESSSDLKIENPKIEIVEKVQENPPKIEVEQKIEDKKEEDKKKEIEAEIQKRVEEALKKENEVKKQKEDAEKERLEKLKQEELKRIDKFFELKEKVEKTPVKVEEKKEEIKENSSKFKKLIDKSREDLKEDDGIEEQTGPSFEE